MVGGLHRLDRHEFEQTLGNSEEWGSLVCCSPWGCIELDMTEQLTEYILHKFNHEVIIAISLVNIHHFI